MRLWLVLLVGLVVAASLSEAARDRKKSRQRQEDSRAQAEEEEFGSALARRLDDKKRDNADKEREEREREREKKEKKEEESSSSEEEDEKEGDEKADNKTIVIPPNGKGKKARRATREAISQWRRTRELRTRRDEALTKAGELNDGAQKPLDAPAAKPKNGTRRFRRERDLVQSLRQQNRLSRRRRDQQLTKATELNSGRQLAVEKTMSDSQPAAPQSPDVVKPVTGEVADEELKPFRKGHAANPANHQQQSSESSEEAGTGEAKLKPFRKGHAANPANHQPAAEAQSRVRRDGDDEEAEKKKAHIRKGLAAHPDNHPKEETAEVGKLKPFRKGHAANPANHQPRERRSEDDDSNSEEEGRERRHAAGEDLKPFRKGHAANPANHQPQQAGQEGQVRGKIHKGHAANPANHKPRERRDSDDEAKAEGEVKLIDKVARRGHAANPANHQAPQEGAQPREYTDEEKHDALVKQAAHKGHMGMKPPKSRVSRSRAAGSKETSLFECLPYVCCACVVSPPPV